MEIILTEEELMLKSTVRDFAERELIPRAPTYDEREEFPWENFKSLGDMGLMGFTVEEPYGGAGGSYAQCAVVIEEIARGCAATSVSYLAHLSLALATFEYGNEEQKTRYLPPLSSGQQLASWCLTEPSSGSDAADIQTTATHQNGGYIINGSKTFITNAEESDVLVVFAATDKSKGAKGVSTFVIERGTEGLSTTPLKGKMGMRGSTTGAIYFQDCFVSEENRIGDEGDGFRIAMKVLDSSRISVAAQAVGIGQAALEESVRYIQQRETFGKPLSERQAIQFMLADMATQLEAARLLTRKAAYLKDSNLPHGKESAMAKLFASEAAAFACDRAVQIFGGAGYFRDSLVERLYRDVRVTEIYEGTSEIQRIVISRAVLKDMSL